jgi:hypothetical protein
MVRHGAFGACGLSERADCQVTDLQGRGGHGFAKRAGANWFRIKWLAGWGLGACLSRPEGVRMAEHVAFRTLIKYSKNFWPC